MLKKLAAVCVAMALAFCTGAACLADTPSSGAPALAEQSSTEVDAPSSSAPAKKQLLRKKRKPIRVPRRLKSVVVVTAAVAACIVTAKVLGLIGYGCEFNNCDDVTSDDGTLYCKLELGKCTVSKCKTKVKPLDSWKERGARFCEQV